MTAVLPNAAGLRSRPDITSVKPRDSRPVLLWAVLGGAFIALQVYVYAAWLVDGVHSVDPGPTDPGSMQTRVNVLQGISTVATVVVIWLLLVRPVIRDRRLSFDGKLVLATLTIVWQDPLVNALAPGFTYNSLYLNVNSWADHVPGFVTPNMDNYPQPVLTTGGFYIWGLIPGMIMTCAVMRRARSRWPGMSNLSLAGIGVLFCMVLDYAFEPLFMWAFGYYTYPAASDVLTAFKGHYYQFPILEPLIWGSTWAAFSFVRFYRNDRGETIAERGSQDVLVGHQRRQTLLSVLALAGVMNLIFLVMNIVFNVAINMQSAAYPSDIVNRSYFMNGLCGPGTSYACPGPGMPFNRTAPGTPGYRIDPQGRLIGPEESVNRGPDPARTYRQGDPAADYYGEYPVPAR